MIDYILLVVFLFICAFFYLKIAEHFNIVDNPNFRSSHTTPVIRGGGILFYISLTLFFFNSGFQYPFFFIGLSLVVIISFLDDLYTLSAKFRFPVHILAVLLVLYQAGLYENYLLLFPLIILGIVFVNTFNFMDGINGITGFYSITTIVFLLLLSILENVMSKDIFIYTLIGLFVFGFYNFRVKARFFSGDSGSISMALLLFFCGVYLATQLNAPILILIISVYGADSIITIFYRLSIKENISKPHRRHLYQKLVDILGWSHLRVAFSFSILQIIINILVFFNYKSTIAVQWIIIVFTIILLSIFYFFIFKYLDRSTQHEK